MAAAPGHRALAALRRRLRGREVRGPAARRAPPPLPHGSKVRLVGPPRRLGTMSVCAFVLTRNRKELLAECVRALLAQTHPVDQVIVLDNASTDGTEEHLRAEGLLDDPRVRFERREENTGGAGGYREGVRLGDRGRPRLALAHGRRRRAAPGRARAPARPPPAQDPGDAGVCSAVVAPRRRRSTSSTAAAWGASSCRCPRRLRAGPARGGRLRVVRRAAHAHRRGRAPPACRSPSSSSATTTPSTRCGCASTGGSASSPRARCCTRCRSAARAPTRRAGSSTAASA